MTEFLILNELHPDEQPGAATIALDYAQVLSMNSETLFMHTSKSLHTEQAELPTKYVSRKTRREASGYLGELIRVGRDLFGIIEARRYLREIRNVNPKKIWIHQIGNYIPRVLLLFLPSVAPVMMTVHDYSLIVPRKLYPRDLSRKQIESLNVKFEAHETSKFETFAGLFKKSVYKVRRLILRFYLRKVKLICISQQQADIYRIFHYRVHAIIPNGIETCDCVNASGLTRGSSVLFLGRITGKGVDRLLASLAKSGMEAVFAGGEEIGELLETYSGKLNAKFLGRLNRADVLKEIHKATFIYQASDCFDVYPTTGIEAIRHGAFPIVSDTTGLRDLVSLIEPSLVLNSTQNFVPLESYVENLKLNGYELSKRLSQVNSRLSTIKQSLNSYLEIM